MLFQSFFLNQMEIIQSDLRVVWKKLLVKFEGSIPFSKTNQDRDTLSMPRKDDKTA